MSLHAIRSPNWHRRERKARSTLRWKVHNERQGLNRLPLLLQWTRRLAAHHSLPKYRELMSRNWQSWQTGKGEGGKRKGRGNTQDKDRPQEKVGALPGYDAVAPSSSASTSKDGKMDDQMKLAMRTMLQANRLEVPEALKELLEPKMTEEVNVAQRQLNAKRKLIQKLERLQNAKERKIQNWDKFQEQLKEHLAAERVKFDTDQDELEKAIKETQSEIDKLKNGDNDMCPPGLPPVDLELEKLAAEDTKCQGGMVPQMVEEQRKIMADQAEMIRQAQHGQLLLAKQMSEMQQQMQYFLTQQKGPFQATPPRATHRSRTPPRSPSMAFTPDQKIKVPAIRPKVELNGKATPSKAATHRQPLPPPQAQVEVINLEKMDELET